MSKQTPLYKTHLDLGGRMVPFAGWEMPVLYTGIIEEHLYTRKVCTIFDICHMGEFIIKGEKAESDLEKLLTCNIASLETEKARYGFLLNNNGGIIDDMIVFKKKKDEFMIVVNAGTRDKDKAWIKSHLSDETNFTDISDNIAKLDVQGPRSADILDEFFNNEVALELKRFNFCSMKWEAIDILVSRTGYTGEKGYELFFDAKQAARIWNGILASGDIKPAGLGARDSLRLEKGYSLYGHEIR
ncbi:MAG: glycine cleavage system aminomethyltransferase GcvT [Candidatus Omnitrophica bacterium]|nr:glycine cleavage system aminomethyltransferase GcvT [Candidatus Omnitrophota bacterium]